MKSELKFLKAGCSLFLEFGIKKVTVEEICQLAGLSKMTFYRIYGNKETFVLKFFENLLETTLADFNKILNAPIDFKEKVIQMTLFEVEGTKKYSGRFLTDSAQWLERPELEEYVEESSRMMRDFFAKGQEDGNVNKDLNIDLIMYVINDWKQKAFDPQVMAMYDNHEAMIRDMTHLFYNGIVG